MALNDPAFFCFSLNIALFLLHRAVWPQFAQKKIYAFLKHGFERWSLDSSFRLVMILGKKSNNNQLHSKRISKQSLLTANNFADVGDMVEFHSALEIHRSGAGS